MWAFYVKFLVFLAASTVLSQRPRSPDCSRQCAPNAQCSNDRCTCNSDVPNGHADFWCFDGGNGAYESCQARGDPHIISFHDEFSLLPMPCRFRLTETLGNMLCLLDVYAVNTMLSNGQVYVNSTEITIAVGLDSITIVLPHSGPAVISGVINQVVSDSLDFSFPNQFSANSGFSLRYDSAMRLWTLISDSSNCDFQLVFRPYTDDIAMIHQDRINGVYIVANQDPLGFPTDVSMYPSSFCSRPQETNRLVESQEMLKLNTTDDTQIYSFLMNGFTQDASQGFAAECTAASDVFKNTCPDMLRVQAVHGCGDFLIGPLLGCVVNDIYSATPISSFAHPFQIFQLCVTAVCSQDRTNCDNYLSYAKAVCSEGLEDLERACSVL